MILHGNVFGCKITVQELNIILGNVIDRKKIFIKVANMNCTFFMQNKGLEMEMKEISQKYPNAVEIIHQFN